MTSRWHSSCKVKGDLARERVNMPYRETTAIEWSTELEQQILRAIKNVRYGSVEIIIHDSQVVQIERREKIRFASERAENKK
jgi:hypothetical protein